LSWLQSEIQTAEEDMPIVWASEKVQKTNAITIVITLDKDIGFIEYAVSRCTYFKHTAAKIKLFYENC